MGISRRRCYVVTGRTNQTVDSNVAFTAGSVRGGNGIVGTLGDVTVRRGGGVMLWKVGKYAADGLQTDQPVTN